MKITITIPDAKENDLLAGFCKAIPKQTMEEGLTDVQFFKAWLKDIIFAAYKTGKIEIAKAKTAPNIDLNIVEVV